MSIPPRRQRPANYRASRFFFPHLAVVVAALSVAVGDSSWSFAAAPQSAAELLPDSTVLYVEVREPAKLIETLLTHPIRSAVEELDQYKQAVDTKQFRQLKSSVAIYEAELERPWPEILKAAAGRQVVAAYDADSKAACLLIRAAEPKVLQQVLEISQQLVRGTTALQGGEDPIQSAEYRGITAYRLGQARYAVFEDWLLVTNKDDLGKAVLDRFTQHIGGKQSLAGKPSFSSALAKMPPAAQLWAYLDVQRVRSAGIGRELFEEKSGNPAIEFLIGGVLETLGEAPAVTAAAEIDHRRIAMSVSVPFAPQAIASEREFFFGPDARGLAPALITTDETILSVAMHRDIRAMWMAAPDLFNEKVNASLAKADSDLTTLFAGRAFGDEILGAITPQMQLVVNRQKFVEDTPQPAVKLPAFALITQLRDQQKMQRQLKVTFQSLIGFLNVAGAMNGQPPFELDQERGDGVEVVSATTVVFDDDDAIDRTAIAFNFSPSLAFVGDYMVVSSTRPLAMELAQHLKKPAPHRASDSKRTNLQSVLDLSKLRDTLADNREQLIAQNMLEEGHDREHAEAEVSTLLGLLDLLDKVTLELATTDDQLILSVDVQNSLVE